MRKQAIAAVLIATLVPVACGEESSSTTPERRGAAQGIVIGKPAPPVTGMSLDGSKSISLKDFHAAHIVVTFWAGWCLPCEEETKVLKQYYAETDRSEFEVVGIAYDEAVSDSQRFARKHDIPWPLLQDVDNTLAKSYGVRGIPIAVFLDHNHVVRTQVFGLTSRERLEEALRS
jgi:peroxiredoxin